MLLQEQMCGQCQSSYTPNSRTADRNWRRQLHHLAGWTLSVAAIENKKLLLLPASVQCVVIRISVFSRVLATFRTVFWSLFGRGEPDAVKLGSYNNSLTEDVGYIIYGIYNIVMVTVLINMLIAMMTRSFTNIAVSRLESGGLIVSWIPLVFPSNTAHREK